MVVGGGRALRGAGSRGRGATLTFGGSPWARAALEAEPDRDQLAKRALEIGAHVGIVAKTPQGPWMVNVWNRDRTLRFRGDRLGEVIAFGLERFAAGADDTGIRWVAGPDGLAHAHRGPRADTLCDLPWTDERFAHPERARCRDCWRALDRRYVAA